MHGQCLGMKQELNTIQEELALLVLQLICVEHLRSYLKFEKSVLSLMTGVAAMVAFCDVLEVTVC